MDSSLDHIMLQETYKRIGLLYMQIGHLTSHHLIVVLKYFGHWLGISLFLLRLLTAFHRGSQDSLLANLPNSLG